VIADNEAFISAHRAATKSIIWWRVKRLRELRQHYARSIHRMRNRSADFVDYRPTLTVLQQLWAASPSTILD
jgi:hypothetical protein